MKKAILQLDTLACPSCVLKIEKAVKALDGVNNDSVHVLFNASKVRLDFDDSKVTVEDIQNSITKMGYEVKKTQVKDL